MSLKLNTIDPSEYVLARIERSALEGVRSLVQKSLASMGLVAAAVDPASLITDAMEAEYLALAMSLWEQVDQAADGFGLDILPLADYYPLVQDSISQSRNKFVEILKALIGKQADMTPTYGEFFFAPDYVPGTGTKPPGLYEVQFGDVRPIIGVLGGGAPAEVPLATGITGGQTFRNVLTANGISTDEKLWLYGETARRTFNGHLQMDGLVFSQWDDPALDISPQDRWIRSDKYRPGDHWGCACVVVPYIPNFGAPIPLTISAQTASARTMAMEAERNELVVSMLEEFYSPSQPRDKEGQWVHTAGVGNTAWEAHRRTLTSLSQSSLERSYGKGIQGLFGNSQTTAPVPWPSAPRKKSDKPISRELIREALNHPKIEAVDPRLLHATQPNIVRTHAEYYMTDAYKKTGKTSADQSNPTNAFPMIYINKDGKHIILSGHHRAAVALAKGETLPALIVREP